MSEVPFGIVRFPSSIVITQFSYHSVPDTVWPLFQNSSARTFILAKFNAVNALSRINIPNTVLENLFGLSDFILSSSRPFLNVIQSETSLIYRYLSLVTILFNMAIFDILG